MERLQMIYSHIKESPESDYIEEYPYLSKKERKIYSQSKFQSTWAKDFINDFPLSEGNLKVSSISPILFNRYNYDLNYKIASTNSHKLVDDDELSILIDEFTTDSHTLVIKNKGSNIKRDIAFIDIEDITLSELALYIEDHDFTNYVIGIQDENEIIDLIREISPTSIISCIGRRNHESVDIIITPLKDRKGYHCINITNRVNDIDNYFNQIRNSDKLGDIMYIPLNSQSQLAEEIGIQHLMNNKLTYLRL